MHEKLARSEDARKAGEKLEGSVCCGERVGFSSDWYYFAREPSKNYFFDFFFLSSSPISFENPPFPLQESRGRHRGTHTQFVESIRRLCLPAPCEGSIKP